MITHLCHILQPSFYQEESWYFYSSLFWYWIQEERESVFGGHLGIINDAAIMNNPQISPFQCYSLISYLAKANDGVSGQEAILQKGDSGSPSSSSTWNHPALGDGASLEKHAAECFIVWTARPGNVIDHFHYTPLGKEVIWCLLDTKESGECGLFMCQRREV